MRKSKRDNTVIRKLQSEAGASISFALFLFLICAVLSAAVLVAGTAAAGRMKGIAESDQNYYAVTSAAELVNELIDGKTVSYVTSTKVFECPMNQIDDTKYKSSSSDGPSLGLEVTKDLVGLINNTDENAPDETERSYSLTSDVDNSALEVDISETVKKTNDGEGRAEFIISDTGSRPFKLKLTFAADVKEDNPPITREEGDEDVTPGKEVSWHIISIVSAYDSGSNWRE